MRGRVVDRGEEAVLGRLEATERQDPEPGAFDIALAARAEDAPPHPSGSCVARAPARTDFFSGVAVRRIEAAQQAIHSPRANPRVACPQSRFARGAEERRERMSRHGRRGSSVVRGCFASVTNGLGHRLPRCRRATHGRWPHPESHQVLQREAGIELDRISACRRPQSRSTASTGAASRAPRPCPSSATGAGAVEAPNLRSCQRRARGLGRRSASRLSGRCKGRCASSAKTASPARRGRQSERRLDRGRRRHLRRPARRPRGADGSVTSRSRQPTNRRPRAWRGGTAAVPWKDQAQRGLGSREPSSGARRPTLRPRPVTAGLKRWRKGGRDVKRNLRSTNQKIRVRNLV